MPWHPSNEQNAAANVGETIHMQKPPIFDEFTQWRGIPPSGHQVNFLGQFTRPAFNSDIVPSDGPVAGKFPRVDQEEIFEWITLLEAVLEAKDTFTVVGSSPAHALFASAGQISPFDLSASKRSQHISGG
jgi:hypothetical protein